MEKQTVTTLFLDIGDVLLSNGWGHEFRHKAAEKFNLDIPDLKIHVVNVVDLMKFQPEIEHPHGLSDGYIRQAAAIKRENRLPETGNAGQAV